MPPVREPLHLAPLSCQQPPPGEAPSSFRHRRHIMSATTWREERTPTCPTPKGTSSCSRCIAPAAGFFYTHEARQKDQCESLSPALPPSISGATREQQRSGMRREQCRPARRRGMCIQRARVLLTAGGVVRSMRHIYSTVSPRPAPRGWMGSNTKRVQRHPRHAARGRRQRRMDDESERTLPERRRRRTALAPGG